MAHHPNSSFNAPPSPIAMGNARKKVNIVAMGSSRTDFDAMQMLEQRPDILDGAEVWGINYMGAIKRLDRVIHVDPVHPYLGHGPVKDMCDYALRDSIPLYTSWPHPMYMNHVVYPFDKVVQTLGVHYFNSSVAYAIALALVEGYTDIGLWGCDFSYPNAHMSESGRGCCEFLIGYGTQRGVRFIIAQSSTLLDVWCGQQPYGFFKDPLQPPGNGGKLMTVPEILEHCQKMRESGNGRFVKPQVFAMGMAVRTPEVAEPIPTVVAEHQAIAAVTPLVVQVPTSVEPETAPEDAPKIVLGAGRHWGKPNGAANASDQLHVRD